MLHILHYTHIRMYVCMYIISMYWGGVVGVVNTRERTHVNSNIWFACACVYFRCCNAHTRSCACHFSANGFFNDPQRYTRGRFYPPIVYYIYVLCLTLNIYMRRTTTAALEFRRTKIYCCSWYFWHVKLITTHVMKKMRICLMGSNFTYTTCKVWVL